MTVASPQYLKLDAVEAAQEKATKDRARAERKAAKQRTSGGDLPATNGADEAKPTVDGQSGEANKENDPERGRSKAPPPAPPRRDPSTTLTASRTRAKSLCLASGGSDTASVDSGTSQPNCKSGNTSDTTSSDHRHSSDNYDSEGRSTKSSSPTTSIESMVQNNNGNNQKKAPSKIASIRSRGTQRMSSCELEEFFARQDDKDASKRSKGNNTSATMRRKSKKKLTKSYHSTPDIQQELLLEQQRLANQGKSGQSNQEANKKSSSQEDVTSHVIYAAVETLTLKNGRIVTSSTCFRQTSCPAGQEPPSSLPAAENTVPRATMAFPQSLSSFRPPPSGQEKKGTEAPIVTTDDQGLPPPPQQPAPTLTNLRPGKGLKSSLVTSSVYSGQESIDLLDDELSDKMAAKKAVKPFIPEPDYSSEEESERHDGPKRDLSTFRAPVVAGTQLPEKQIAQAEVALEKPDIVASSMTARKASMDSNMSLTSSSSSTQSTAKEQLKAAEKSSDDSSSSSGSQSLPPPPSFPPPVPQATGDSLLSEGVNKVKATIRELERRSSLTGSDAVPASSTLRPQKKPLAECASSSSASSSSSSAALRMSRSCFEVDCMDSNLCQKDEQPRSLGTINFDGMSSTQTIRTVQTSARRNSAQLSEKIASLVAAQASLKLQQSLADGADSVNDSSTYGTIGSKAAPTTAKTWSEISSEIRAVKGAPVTVVSNSISSQSVARPVSAPSARQMAAKSETIKVHVNAPGSAAANEVDVMAELVPPPPQFAAPPPHQQGHASGNQVQRAASAQLGQRAGQIQLQVQGHPPRQLSPQTQPGTIKILTGPQAQQQHHVIHKPKASPAAQLIADHSAQQDGRKTATPPPPPPEFCDTSAAARLGVSCHSQQLGNHNLAITAAQWAAMTPQQQQQYRAYVQQIKHQQLTQQQFATLGRSYSGARQSQVQQQQQQAGQVALSRSTDALEPGKHYVIYPASSSSPAGPQYHQFATLSRAQQGQAAKAAAAAMSYNDFTRLTVQNRLVRQNQASPQPNQMSQQQVNQINQQQQHPQQFILTQQQAQQLYQKQQQQQAHATHAHEAGGTGQQPQQQTIYIGHHHHPQPPLTAQQLQQMAMQHQAQVAHQHMHHQPQHSGQPQGGQARPTTPQQQQQQQMMLQQQARYQMMQQQQQQQQQMKQGVIYQQLPPKAGQAMPAAPAVPPPPGPTPSQQPSQIQQQPQRQVPAFLRKSMVEWVSDDIQEWLTTIGMGEHTGKLEGLTGVKLLRLDQNNLMELGIRQAQHRVYIQEKVKQLLHYQQQHPSAAN
ncbi:hypothetical protein HDE_05700 [Halotydeus destructor]|nr:hypothetical protein HDE_05700 [Halotydeus destructor]